MVALITRNHIELYFIASPKSGTAYPGVREYIFPISSFVKQDQPTVGWARQVFLYRN
jgi:hypothetical protein